MQLITKIAMTHKNRISLLTAWLVSLILFGCDPGHFGKSIVRNESPYKLELKYKTHYNDTSLIIQPNTSVDIYKFAGIGAGKGYDCCPCDFTTITLQVADTSKTLIKSINDRNSWVILNPNKRYFSSKAITCSFSITQSDIRETIK
jgi:hypothetical protein